MRNARQSLPAASLRTANRLPAGRVMRLVSNSLICLILSSIGPAIFGREAKFLPALREAAGPRPWLWIEAQPSPKQRRSGGRINPAAPFPPRRLPRRRRKAANRGARQAAGDEPTSRERRSSSGQSSSSTGGWATCWTKWTTTGPRHSATATRPLTRRRSEPRSAVRTAIACSKAGQLSGSSKTSEKLVSPCECSAAPRSKLRRGACRLVEQEARLDLAISGDADRGGVERGNPCDQALGRAGLGEIALADDDAVGQEPLACGLRAFLRD